MEHKVIAVRFLALVGFVTLCLIAITALWLATAPDENTGITIPLEKNLTTERYFKNINDRPLIRSEKIHVVKVNVLSESPKTATFKIHYDLKYDESLDDIWISASILRNSGWPSMHYYHPAKVTAGYGNSAVVVLGVADESKLALLTSRSIIISFYKGGHSPFHEVRYEYERVWCRNATEINDLWKQPYPVENGSKYSITGTRSVSRLCLKDEH